MSGRRGRIGSGRIPHSPDRSRGNRHQQRNDSAGSSHQQASARENWRQPGNSQRARTHYPNNASASRGNLSWQQERNQEENQPRKQFNPFSFYNLKKIANEGADNDAVKILANSDYDFEGFIEEDIRMDIFILIIKVLGRVCLSDYDESKHKILGIMCESTKFVGSFMPKIMAAADEKTPQEVQDLLNYILTVFEGVAQCMPLTACDKLLTTINGCKFCCKGLHESGKVIFSDIILQRFEDISNALNTKKSEKTNVKELKRESRNERLQKLAPPNNFRTMSVYPTSEDVLCRDDMVFLRPNLVRGKYDDIEHYLDVQFRLLREDFIRPLRHGIEAYISGDKKKLRDTSVRVYKGVQFIRSDDKVVKTNPRHKDVEGILVQFDPQKKHRKVDWEHNRRFMYGSLLCFSKDNFRTLLISTVSDREINNLSAGLLRVVFGQELEENIYHHKYTMCESEVFFEPYFHVLKTLQSLETSTFPLPEYFIYIQEEDFPPAYLEPNPFPPQYELPVGGEKWPVIVTDCKTWPRPNELSVDTSQYMALFAALTRELVVIQGPPGTGKTYMGLRITEILITNKSKTRMTTPILVVCLTNHALDQFLVSILKLTKKVIRIGGQSKCRELDEYNLRVVKRQTKSRDQLKLIINLKEEIRRLQFDVSELDACVKIIKDKNGIIAFEMFEEFGILPREAVQAFQNNRFLKWLLAEMMGELKPRVEVVGNVKFCLLIEQFDNSIEELEVAKIQRMHEIDLEFVNQTQQELQHDKEWIEKNLQNEELATTEQCEKWIKYLWKLDIYQKWQLYRFWLQQLEDCILNNIMTKENDILKKNKELAELQIVDDLEILRECDVVGMTTTGAARLHKLLRKLGPEIVIVEEAAEVMETHVVACLSEKCCHLILIGDHKQLRPQIATYELETKYSFDVSLFERMVQNRAKCITLKVQHRMAPEIAKLVTPSIYPELLNAAEVKIYPEIKGIPKRLFFIDHTHPEEMMDTDSNSRINRFEASFILALCRHLILQGYDPSKITILTTYRGQMFYMRKAMRDVESLKGVLAQVVDNYQGEENDIILLSLVRSNEEKHIGFLKTENRVCVAMSRAKHGLYIVGNMECLKNAAKVTPDENIWVKINATLQEQNAIGKELILRCDVHPEQSCTVSTSKDFTQKSPEGGCRLLCTSQLLCTHPCNRVCHVLQRDHLDMKCQSPCKRLCSANLHLCKKKCYENCGDCMVAVEKTLRCGHKTTVSCHIDIRSIQCEVIVAKIFEPCRHIANVKCHIDPRSTCPCDCDFRLPCGHCCINKCHANEDPDHLAYKCKKPCTRPNAGCSMNHECGKICCDECSDCIVKVPKKRSCGHTHHVMCSSNVEMVECEKKCTRTLNCGHKCLRTCNEICDPCLQKTPKRSSCGHDIIVGCGITPSRKLCNKKCTLLLPCGHPCMTTCNKPCTDKCLVEVTKVKGACGHMVPLQCWEKQRGMREPSSTSRCAEPCNTILECEHLCSGTCGTCYQGRFHSLCDMPCGRVLVCGHKCKQPCAVMCPPCPEKCSFICSHSKCSKKCGEPCAPCQERCKWQCEHKRCKRRCGEICDRDPCDEPCPKRLKCGHECIGFCGEPCPRLCRICNNEEVTEIFFGDEDEPDSRFIALVDCGHCIEVTGMSNWMAQNEDMVSKKTCPRCTQEIKRSFRFGTAIKHSFHDISMVKRKTFGNLREIEVKRQELEKKAADLLNELIANPDTHKFEELQWGLKATVNSLGTTVGKRRNVLSSTSIRCLEIEVDVLAHVCEVWQKADKLPTDHKNELMHHANLILDNLEAKKHRLSQQQVQDFNLEIMRLQRILQYLTFKKDALIYPEVRIWLDKYKNIVLDFTKRYSEERHRESQILFNQIKEHVSRYLPGLGITEFERVNIIQALHLSQGHWFKCPNGHPYIITECGGAMQESTCNECGARIGGGHHALRNDNSHFGLMDNSRHAAWSQGANLLNYANL